tara:strand:- start:3296 stop:3541 length:246 start_codon:yes stop_codon:yes gene_type:complete
VGKAEFVVIYMHILLKYYYLKNMEDTGNFIFTLTATFAAGMTLIYFPLRFFLTLTARSRRLKLLQKIRRLRDELGQPYENT